MMQHQLEESASVHQSWRINVNDIGPPKTTKLRARVTRRQLMSSGMAAMAAPLAGWSANPPDDRRDPSRTFDLPSIGLSIEKQATLLAIDDFLLPLRKNLCYYLTKPNVRKDPVVVPSRDNPAAPDFASADLYGAVLRDGNKFRLWYLGGRRGPQAGELLGVAHLCYAESEDGIRWTKPNLGQVAIDGNRNNNAFAIPEPDTEGIAVIKDDDDPKPMRRYKMIYQRRHPGKYWTMATATSGDGIRWEYAKELPIADFVEFSSFYKHNGLYVVHAQTVSPYWRSEGGHRTGRQGVAWVSPDFDHWLQEAAEAFFLPEPVKPEDRGANKTYDQVHLGVGAASLGNVLVGVYCIWHEGGAEKGFSFGKTSGDFGLVVSHDGLHFREPAKGHVYLSSQESAVMGASDRAHPTILCQGNGILNLGEETRLYHGRWLNLPERSDWYGEIALATLPRDRWGALGLFPDKTEGSAWSAAFRLPSSGCEIVLNADAAQNMRVEVADERFTLLPEYSGANNGVANAKGKLESAVTWRNKDGLAGLGGRNVRLRLHLKKQGISDPRLYAIYLRS